VQRLIQIILLAVLLICCGCSRERYRLRADRDAYTLIHQKSAYTPWQPGNFTIDIPKGVRMAPAGYTDDPCLPPPAPSLYAYELPQVVQRDPARFNATSTIADELSEAVVSVSGQKLLRLPAGEQTEAGKVTWASGNSGEASRVNIDRVAFLQAEDETRSAVVPPEPTSDVAAGAAEAALIDGVRAGALSGIGDLVGGSRIVPLKKEAWSSIPANCLMRTLEFSSVRDEYEQTFGQQPPESLFSTASKLTLEDLINVAVRNSREYQTQKEILYRAALRLSLERFDYQLKFTPVGNGTRVDWRHRNDVGITENSLDVESGAAVERVLATGGTLLAGFANSVLLTFNGPNGFASDVSSELFAEVTQPLLQRDIVFERLTQAERDLVYAARDYARFRKQFFRDIAADYYRLLLTYRSIEIDMLDYFSNQRGFDQRKSEYGLIQKIPRFQVDQFEQNALGSRSSVIRSCNDLEQSFDLLKLRLGIPPETPINLDLTELELLTARDEVTVAVELASRAYRNLDDELQNRGLEMQDIDDRLLIGNAAIQLAQKLREQILLQEKISGEPNEEALQAATALLDDLQMEALAIQTKDYRRQLAVGTGGPRPAPPTKLFFLRMNLIDSLLLLGERQNATANDASMAERLEALRARYKQLSDELDGVYLRLSERNDDLTSEENVQRRNAELIRVAEISQRAEGLLSEVEVVVREDETLDASSLVLQVLRLGEQLETQSGLVPIDMDVDEAMLTALVTRFDLMNQRGALADAWRQIKLAGDDLRSVLNLRASQVVRTDSTGNRPFDFTFDESETRLGLTFDAPLNRRAQRNDYRFALINYNLALRNLLEAEDEIKFAIRSDLRSLQLDREQYQIAVASAALASDRRTSTRKQLDLGIEGITARDFLEAQTAYTASLNGVARAHIDYILDRIDLFLDLELLQVDDAGFWPDLYDEQMQPEARMDLPPGSGPAYGCLPPWVHYSHCIRRMDCIPFGQPLIYGSGEAVQGVPGDMNAEDVNAGGVNSGGLDMQPEFDSRGMEQGELEEMPAPNGMPPEPLQGPETLELKRSLDFYDAPGNRGY